MTKFVVRRLVWTIPVLLLVILMAVDRRRHHTARPQGAHLVVHERDERRHHHGGAAPLAAGDQGRDLVAERLAGAGGKQHHGVAPGDQRVDRLALPRPVLEVTEHLAQDARRVQPRREDRLHPAFLPPTSDVGRRRRARCALRKLYGQSPPPALEKANQAERPSFRAQCDFAMIFQHAFELAPLPIAFLARLMASPYFFME